MAEFFHQLKEVLLSYNFISDTLDILLIAFLIYGLLRQLRRTQSIQVIKGVISIAVLYAVVLLLNMQTTQYLFNGVFKDLFILFVVVFNNEIRQALERFGNRSLSVSSIFGGGLKHYDETLDSINAVCRACASMSRDRIGSLIIFQRNSFLGDIEKMSVEIDAKTTSDLLCGIFFPNSALHDGAIVIKDGRIVAARCIVPLNNDIATDEHVGTRHRAALSVSANTDAVAVVTSEETGIISIAYDGKMERGLTDSVLREKLGELLLGKDGGTDAGKFAAILKKRSRDHAKKS